MLPSHRHNAKVIYFALSFAVVVVELGHVTDFMWEKSPLWAQHFIIATYPKLLLVVAGFLAGIVYALISPGFLNSIRKRLLKRLGSSTSSTEDETRGAHALESGSNDETAKNVRSL